MRKWRDRFAGQGEAGLQDRSSRPHRSPTRLDAAAEGEIARLRRERRSGPAIARQLGRPLSTVGAVLRRLGLGRLAALDPKPPVIRRIRGIGHRITGHQAGLLRNRGIGWDHLHVAIDDASRLAYTEILADDRTVSATAFLARALRFFDGHGVRVERVMTDNGSAYRSHAFAAASNATAGLPQPCRLSPACASGTRSNSPRWRAAAGERPCTD